VFDIFVEGALTLNDFDIFRDAPGKNVPLVVSSPTTFVISDGTMTIEFVRIMGDPQINGIEVIYVGPPINPTAPTAPSAPVTVPVKVPVTVPVAPVNVPVAPVPVSAPVSGGSLVHRINSGAANVVIVPPNNVVWNPDQYASSGVPYTTCGTTTTSMYCTSRYFRTKDAAPYLYNIPVPESNRKYEVRLHFAEQVCFGSFVMRCVVHMAHPIKPNTH
jgi:hypothetical protein